MSVYKTLCILIRAKETSMSDLIIQQNESSCVTGWDSAQYVSVLLYWKLLFYLLYGVRFLIAHPFEISYCFGGDSLYLACLLRSSE